jgi:hypothetical protein
MDSSVESVATLTNEQLSRYQNDGFLTVTEAVLPPDQVNFALQRIDRLYDRWSELPPYLAQGDSNDGNVPLIAKIHRVTACDGVLAHCALLETCRRIARSILGRKNVWCRFDSALYKFPGAGSVHWHQDFSSSKLGIPKRSVHFWIPLNDHSSNSGSLVFVPGSHRNGPELPEAAVPPPESVEEATHLSRVPLSVGGFSLHTPWTIHGSDPNLGQDVRKALALEFSAGASAAVRQIGRPLVGALFVHGRHHSERRRRQTPPHS